jgi:hypothetical protein
LIKYPDTARFNIPKYLYKMNMVCNEKKRSSL